jgi:hypothetical protein
LPGGQELGFGRGAAQVHEAEHGQDQHDRGRDQGDDARDQRDRPICQNA